ncbi:MAG TPA: sphingosine kinase [Rhodospirillaceae bacterium]|nr:sphingosine kinase [Rhodospirillaceae bacterium]
MRIAAVINARAGSLTDGAASGLATRLSALWTAQGHQPAMVIAGGKDFGRAVKAACGDPLVDVVVIGGGDGSLSRSLGHLAGSGKLAAVLPLGTMNYMAGEIGLPADVEAAAALLGSGRRIEIDLGRVNGRLFVIRACLGAFAEFSRARDKTRRKGGDMLEAALSGLARVGKRMDLIEGDLLGPDGPTAIATPFLMVTNNLCRDGDPFEMRRDRLDGGTLGVYAGRGGGALGLAALGLQAALGRWPGNEGLAWAAMPWLELHTTGKKQTLSIDGEAEKMKGPFRFDILPRALQMLVP